MGKSLKESLAIIKARAHALRHRQKAPELIDDHVETGAVTKGASEETLAKKAAKKDKPESGGDLEDILASYKIGDAGPIESIEPGEERSLDGETFYLVRPVGDAVDPAAPREAEVFGRLGSWPDHVEATAFGARSPRKERRQPPFDRETACFLDIETTGLSPNTYLFLIGLMFWEKGQFVVEQVFARNYAEEPAVLRYVRDTLSRFEVVITYNGARFDLPFVETRNAVNRVTQLKPIASVDLLYTARRVFRGILPNCRLGTVERHIRGIDRTGDIPGMHIPGAYHDYVRTDDARAMKNVLYHNRMDLFTMAVLVNRLADPSA
jgi:uncharacterized protein YprB with RNaseH-like and TPR domain